MFRGLAMLVCVLLLDILRVHNSRLGKIGRFLEFPKYFIPYFHGGIHVTVSYIGGGAYIIRECYIREL